MLYTCAYLGRLSRRAMLERDLAVRRVRPSLHVTVTLLTQYDPMITDFLLVTGCQFGVVVTRWSRSTLRRARIPRPTQPQPTATE